MSGNRISRRALLASMGMAGAAVLTENVWKGGLPATAEAKGGTVTESVYGLDKVKVKDLKDMDFVIAVTIAELRAETDPNPDYVYYVIDTGQDGMFGYDPSDTTTPDNTGTVVAAAAGGRFKRMFEGGLEVKWFGAKGDGETDDTLSVRAAMQAARGKEVRFAAGVYKLTDTIAIPRNTFVRGAGCSSWFPFGQLRNNVPNSILDMENGTILKFVGNASVTFSTNRSDFQNFTCAVKLEPDADGVQLSDLKILSSFRIRDENGNITTSDTDQHAMFDVGLWIDNADHVKLNGIGVVGYWQKAGLLLDASGRLGATQEFGAIEYCVVSNSIFQGKIGMAALGGDEGIPPDETGFLKPTGDDLTEGAFGLSHLFVSDCFFSGTDHHSNGFADGWQSRIAPDSTPLKIDGFIGSGVPYRINHPRFVNCSIQTRESASIVLDRVIRPAFINCRAESGPIRASKHTVLPRLINCEFPYNRTNAIYQEIEHCQGAHITPSFRRLAHIHLKEYQFQIELRNNNGVIEHRLTKPFAISAGAKSKDVEALFRYAIKEAGWDYQAWTPTPVPGSTMNDDYSKGLFLGEKAFQAKYSLVTSVTFDNHADYQEAELIVVQSRAADTGLWARAAAYSAPTVPYKMATYNTVLKIELRNGSGPATALTTNLPMEAQGAASLTLRVRGLFYEQAYGLG